MSELAELLCDAIVQASPETRARIRAALEINGPPAAAPERRSVYTTSTLAAELAVSARAVRGWIQAGELRATMRAGRWIIAADEVAGWIASGETPASAASGPRARSRVSKPRPSAGTGVMADARGKCGL